MAAVTPQTILCEIERYYPAERAVKAAALPSPRTLYASQRRVQLYYEEWLKQG